MNGIIAELEAPLKSMRNPVLCFSGGLDSTVLLKNVKEFCENFTAVFFRLPMNTERQTGLAEDIASFLDIPLKIIDLGWDDLRGIEGNGPDRCYICKRTMYSAARRLAGSMGSDTIIAGDNADDDMSDRPGHRAGMEIGVVNPLRDAGIGRTRIVGAISEMNLPFHMVKDTCMATRYPVGTPIGEREMRFAEECERAVRKVSGLEQLRVRIKGDRATVTTDISEMDQLVRFRTQITYELKSRGLDCDLDLKGY